MQKNDISKYEYVSFDVFDTLIFRSVATPEDIFIIVQELYKEDRMHDILILQRQNKS